jgi:hypothetical protein
MPGTRWSSHKELAAKAPHKLAGPHLPASLTKLEQAVKRAHAAYDKAERAAHEQQRAEAATDATEESPVDGEFDEDLADAA